MLNLFSKSLRFSVFKTTLVRRLFPRSSSSSPAASDNSFAVSYLIDSLGFLPEKAISASRYLKFKTPDRADSVIAFLKHQGYTETQICNLVQKNPLALICTPEKNLLPRFEFFTSIGLSGSDIFNLFTARPALLCRSLKNYIEPNYNSLRNLLQSDDRTLIAIRRCSWVLDLSFQANIIPNIQLLRDVGVPGSKMLYYLSGEPRVFLATTQQFKRDVEQVMEMGFDPLKARFMAAVHALSSINKSTWERKMETYKKWGWSKDQIMQAFRSNPRCMLNIEEKINTVMDFLVNKMGFKASIIANHSVLIAYSMEKRIIPRCLVYKYYLDNRLMKDEKYSGFPIWLKCSESMFMKRLEICEKEAPGVLKFYQDKKDLAK